MASHRVSPSPAQRCRRGADAPGRKSHARQAARKAGTLSSSTRAVAPGYRIAWRTPAFPGPCRPSGNRRRTHRRQCDSACRSASRDGLRNRPWAFGDVPLPDPCTRAGGVSKPMSCALPSVSAARPCRVTPGHHHRTGRELATNAIVRPTIASGRRLGNACQIVRSESGPSCTVSLSNFFDLGTISAASTLPTRIRSS